jgi:hypothetical protein
VRPRRIGLQHRLHVAWRGHDDDRTHRRQAQGEELAVAGAAQDAERVAVQGDGLRHRPGGRTRRELGLRARSRARPR